MSESLGFIGFYGMTPSIDWFKGTGIDPEDDDKPLNVLLSEVGDIRHLLLTLSDMIPFDGSK